MKDDLKQLDDLIRSYQYLNDLNALMAVLLSAYPQEIDDSGVFKNSDILQCFKAHVPPEESVSLSRINLLLHNEDIKRTALRNFRKLVFADLLVQVYEAVLSHFGRKKKRRLIEGTPLVNIATILRNTIAHKSLPSRDIQHDRQAMFDANGEICWGMISISKSVLLKEGTITHKVIAKEHIWKVIFGLRDIYEMELRGTSEDEIVAFCKCSPSVNFPS